MGHYNAYRIFQSRYIIFDDCVFSLSIAEMVSSGKGTFFYAELLLLQQFVAFFHLHTNAVYK